MATETKKEIELYDGDTKVYPKTYLSAIDAFKTDGTEVTLSQYINDLIEEKVKSILGITAVDDNTVTFNKTIVSDSVKGAVWNS